MRWITAVLILLVVVLIVPTMSAAQSAPATASVTVPRLVHITGVFQPVDGQPPAAVEVATVSIYAEADGGLPVWQERQTVTVEKTTGRFTLLLGASYPEGVPAEVFASGQAQWMSLLFERLGETEQPRVRIASVPYALKASDAETLGGLPASAYLRAPADDPASAGVAKGDPSLAVASTADAAVLAGTANYLAKYVNATDLGNSAVYETPTVRVPTGAVGIGTTTPADVLHLQFTNTLGQITGLAVQNLGNTNTSYSGMLFYDQFGGLAQFQGFNNVTHEYRINNIATTPSINFMTGGVSRFFVAPSGNIGIGTTSPAVSLEVSNALGLPNGNITAATYSASGLGSVFSGRKARGTFAAPTGVLNGDNLALFRGFGYAATSYGAGGAGITMRAAENWTDTAQGAAIHFMTTATGTTTQVNRMTLDPFGNLGLGTTGPQAALDMVRETPGPLEISLTRFAGTSSSGEPNIVLRTARGTRAAPSAVQFGDELGGMFATGYGATGFGDDGGFGFGGFAAENWTDAAHGALMVFAATPIGSSEAEINMVIMPGGNVGIGTFTDFPTITDKLQVSGDIRVGTTGTDGCIKNFAGTGLIGVCSSDRRFKKDITPFKPALNQLTALQPVHYFWRAADFPQQKFGDSRAYGLIAQDVEDVLPELVVTNEDGFKAVDYTKLPLLTIQAVKELKLENDDLKAGNEALKQRVDALERLVTEMLAAAGDR